MNGIGFWRQVYHLREMDVIGRAWKTAQLNEYMERPRGEYAASTIAVRPHNSCVSLEGHGIGDFVSKGQSPKVWRVGRGLFQLIEDPDDDPETQQAQMRRAMARAEELRAKKRTATMHSPIASISQTPVAQPKPEIRSSEAGLKKMEDLSTEQKALAIVREFLKDRYGDDVEIEEDRDGVDLRVTVDGRTERIEVKGTADSTIAWEKLKVSSRKSHDALVRGDALIYRVVDVHSADPRIYILIHGEDFTLEPEPDGQ